MTNLLDLISRIFISSVFLFSAANKILQYEATVQFMEGFNIPGILLIPTIIFEIILPILIIIGYQTKLAAGILALFCLATGFIFHFDLANQMETVALLKNFGLAGGLFFLTINGPKDFILFKKKKYVKL
jgi:putative oxidoreductase|tara:strand:- start:295 stop:681 length:387 start_codon:yes stop_codon:yes gene_type:complete